jgi:hypothetical protein
MPLNKSLRVGSTEPGPDASIEEVVDKQKEGTDAQATMADTQAEVDALSVPPDPAVPSGILSVIIHQINGCMSPYLPSHLTSLMNNARSGKTRYQRLHRRS